MGFDPEVHRRRTIRLDGYDYAENGAYFVTVCTQGRACLFGDIVGGVLQPNASGRMVAEIWQDLPTRFPQAAPDEFVVMPNHFHGILILFSPPDVGAPLVGARSPSVANVGAPLVGALDHGRPEAGRINARRAGTRPAPTLGDIVGAFKSLSTDAYIHGVEHHGWPPFPGRLWQRNYYDRIIRGTDEWQRVQQYIADNPARWGEDGENPENIPNRKPESLRDFRG